MALPALRAIPQRHPDAAIHILARPYVADIYRINNWRERNPL